jgi:hypothetical protein
MNLKIIEAKKSKEVFLDLIPSKNTVTQWTKIAVITLMSFGPMNISAQEANPDTSVNQNQTTEDNLLEKDKDGNMYFEKNPKNLLTHKEIKKIINENIYGFTPDQLAVIEGLSLNLESGHFFYTPELIKIANKKHNKGLGLPYRTYFDLVADVAEVVRHRNISDAKGSNSLNQKFKNEIQKIHEFHIKVVKKNDKEAGLGALILLLLVPASIYGAVRLIRVVKPNF